MRRATSCAMYNQKHRPYSTYRQNGVLYKRAPVFVCFDKGFDARKRFYFGKGCGRIALPYIDVSWCAGFIKIWIAGHWIQARRNRTGRIELAYA